MTITAAVIVAAAMNGGKKVNAGARANGAPEDCAANATMYIKLRDTQPGA